MPSHVIPAEAGIFTCEALAKTDFAWFSRAGNIQELQLLTNSLDSGFHRSDDKIGIFSQLHSYVGTVYIQEKQKTGRAKTKPVADYDKIVLEIAI